jgi:hypothetical protein
VFLFCFSRLFYPMLPVSPDCVVFLFCVSPSFLPYVASFSGLCCVTKRRETKQKQSTIQRNWQHRIDKTERNKHSTIQRNWQHRVEKTERHKTKTQHNPGCQFLWIVLCFCFVSLRLVYPMLPVSLDCAVFVFFRLVYPMLPVSLDCALFLFCFSPSCVLVT